MNSEFFLSTTKNFFAQLKEKYNIELENLVYYRGETHYFVMTVKKDSLLQRGVCKKDASEISQLLCRENIDRKQIDALVRQVASYIELPEECPFAISSKGGINDVQVFDFSKKRESTHPFLIKEYDVPNAPKAELIVALVGDALVEPFWPLGTGANRAILSALDTAWMIKKVFTQTSASLQDILKESTEYYRIMVAASPEDLKPNFGMHTINPSTRYKKSTHGHFH